MKIILMGSGYFGFYILGRFLQEKHDMVIIDQNPLILKQFSENYDVLTIEGNGASNDILRRAEIEKTDMILALSDSDESNIVACQIANYYGVPKKIARITNDIHSCFPSTSEDYLSSIGIDFIVNPYHSCAKEFFNSIILGEITEEMSFAEGQVVLGAFSVSQDHSFLRKPLKDIKELHAYEFRFIAFSRGDQLIIPRGDSFFEEGDEVFFICHRQQRQVLMDVFNIQLYSPKKVVINGGGGVGLHLAKMLEDEKIEVKMIEHDPQRANFLSDQLSRTMVFQGHSTDFDFLNEMDLLGVDAFVSVTEDDQSNILSCVFAKQMLVKKTYCLVKKAGYINMLSSMMKINDIIDIGSVFINTIIRFLRKSTVASVGSLRHIDAEVIEIVIEEGFKVVDKKISELDFPHGSIIGLIIRGKNIIFAKGSEILEKGDRLIVFYLPSTIEKINDIFGKKLL